MSDTLRTDSVEFQGNQGMYHREAQVGFARVLTDNVVMAFLADVFIVESHRGKGLGTWLIEVVTVDLESDKRQ
jgi:GNAT superfamily N-acetyltransferase